MGTKRHNYVDTRQDDYNPITREEIAATARNIMPGTTKMTLYNEVVTGYDDNDKGRSGGPRKKSEVCTVILKGRWLAMFRRPNGLICSRTYVELAEAARGEKI